MKKIHWLWRSLGRNLKPTVAPRHLLRTAAGAVSPRENGNWISETTDLAKAWKWQSRRKTIFSNSRCSPPAQYTHTAAAKSVPRVDDHKPTAPLNILSKPTPPRRGYTDRLGQKDGQEFEASLGYTVGSQ